MAGGGMWGFDQRAQPSRWVAACLLAGLMAVAPMAQAGLLGALIGGAIAHHEEGKARQDGQPAAGVAGVVAGSAAGSLAEGMAVHEVKDHPFLALAGGAVATMAVDGEARGYLEKHQCSNDDPPYWSCPGIPGQHVLPVEAKDLYIEARTERLRKNLTAAGEPKPGKGCAAHHIVMKDDGKFPASKNARKILEECGIDIDSAENGVWLPDTQEDSACHGVYHRTLHTQDYADYVYRLLKFAKEKSGCDGVVSALKDIKSGLTNER